MCAFINRTGIKTHCKNLFLHIIGGTFTRSDYFVHKVPEIYIFLYLLGVF